MQSKTRTGFLFFLLFFFAILSAISYVYFGNQNARPWSNKEPSSASIGAGEFHSFSSWHTLTDEERVDLLSKDARKLSGEKEIYQVLPQARIPKQTFGLKLLAMFAGSGKKTASYQVVLLYEKGFYIEEEKVNSAPDYAAEVEDAIKAKERGELKSDSLPYLSEINGMTAFVGKPGYNIIHEAVKEPRPAVVIWFDPNTGVETRIFGPVDLSLTDKDLLVVAESMY
jgi:hypothetical protein